MMSSVSVSYLRLRVAVVAVAGAVAVTAAVVSGVIVSGMPLSTRLDPTVVTVTPGGALIMDNTTFAPDAAVAVYEIVDG